MATLTTELTGTPAAERLFEWAKRNQRLAMIGGGLILLLAGGVWFSVTAAARRGAFAARALTAARAAADAGNLPLAANDLSRLINAYGGTTAAQEAALLLAQVRLLQDQAPLAIADLRKFTSEGPKSQFRGPAFALLGAALEEQGQVAEGAAAYDAAAAAYAYDAVKAQYLLDAARAYRLANDTALAAARYERVITEFKTQPSAIEAKVRLAEMRATPLKKS